MDEISLLVSGNNLSDNAWWLGLLESDATVPIPLDGSEGGLWSGNFVPPPPRPIYLEEGVSSDGLTTCDLCSWAWQNGKSLTIDTALGTTGRVEWVLTLVIVSLISAVIGAVIMVTVLYCRRMKNAVLNDVGNTNSAHSNQRPPIAVPDDKIISHSFSNPDKHRGVWSCIFRKTSTIPQLDAPPPSSTENHYTHMDETYNSTDEALYAELDRYSSSSPAYQNSGYIDPDVPSSSAPSSAYYSDLSVNIVNDRMYEVVGLATTPVYEVNDPLSKSVKLSSISETVTVPSDYV